MSLPSVTRVSDLAIAEGKVHAGQGEYIVYYALSKRKKKELTREIYEKVYKIFNDYSFFAIVARGSDSAKDECAHRYEIIQTKVKEIDPTLEVVFVPRTLYQLLFIRECILEDLTNRSVCPYLSPFPYRLSLKNFNGDQQKYNAFLQESEADRFVRKCWHLCYFDNPGDNDHPGVKEVAFRLNQIAVLALSPTSDGFTHQELVALAEREITFLKAHYKKGLDEMEKIRKGEEIDIVCSCSTPGPTTNFGFESRRGDIKPMGIRNETDAQILRDAITLECSKTAQVSIILYRGGRFQEDLPYCLDAKDNPYSLSYGSSLFAGCIFDGGATAFYYMRNEPSAYAISVPFDQLFTSPFYIPPTNTVAQLFGDGEIFHGRSKVWKGVDVGGIRGMNSGSNGGRREHLKTNLTKDEFIAQFQLYKSRAIQLK